MDRHLKMVLYLYNNFERGKKTCSCGQGLDILIDYYLLNRCLFVLAGDKNVLEPDDPSL